MTSLTNHLTANRDVTDRPLQVPLMDEAGVYTVPEPQQKPGKGDWKHENLMTSITKVEAVKVSSETAKPKPQVFAHLQPDTPDPGRSREDSGPRHGLGGPAGI